VIRYRLIKPKYEGIIGFIIRLYNTIIYRIAEDRARELKRYNLKRRYLIQIENILYIISREDHLIMQKLTGYGFDFLYRIKYCRFYTDDRKKKQTKDNIPRRDAQTSRLVEIC
jgi:hypothetical protein